MRKYFNGNYVVPYPKSSEVQKKRSSTQFGTKFDRNLLDLFELTGPFLSDQPALKSRWGDAKFRLGDASPLQFKYCIQPYEIFFAVLKLFLTKTAFYAKFAGRFSGSKTKVT